MKKNRTLPILVLISACGSMRAEISMVPAEPTNPNPHFLGDEELHASGTLEGPGYVHVASESRALVGTMSAGCGTTPPYGAGTYTQGITITINGVTRTFNLGVGSGYVPTVPQRGVSAYAGRGGSGATIYAWGVWHLLSGVAVYPDPLPQSFCQNQGCWDNQVDGTDAMFIFGPGGLLDWVEAHYCIDTGREVGYGFSMGGAWTNVMACASGRLAAFYTVEGPLPAGLGSNWGSDGGSNMNPDGACVPGPLGAVGFNEEWNTNDTVVTQAQAYGTALYWISNENDGSIPDAFADPEWDGSVNPVGYAVGSPNPPGLATFWTPDAGGHAPNNPRTAIAVALALGAY